ncbi:MAG: hypothetical protein ACRDUV_13485 [Pseudonocardiaceae bacterium]
MGARFLPATEFEPDTEHDRSSITGERLDAGWTDADREWAADREAARYEDAFWGGGL